MQKLEQYREYQLKDLPEPDFKVWVIDELTSLMNDFGQNINDDMLKHTASRLYEKLRTAYRSWSVGEVHAVFQVGLSGGYGSFRRVTVQAIFMWLKMAQNQRKTNIVEQNIKESNVYKCANDDPRYGNPESDFIIWATKNLICLNYIHPEWDPMKEQQVSPKIKELAKTYHQVKNKPKELYSFKNTLLNE